MSFTSEAYKVEMTLMKPKILKRKHTYWHQLARMMLGFGFKPTVVGHLVKDVFPETEVNGRHIGAYKRRLISDGELEVPDKPTMNRNEASKLAPEIVSTEDMFIYKCTVGSAKKSLQCFEFKFKGEEVNQLEAVQEWITTKKIQ